MNAIFDKRVGNHLKPIDAADVLCCLGEMVVAGNVRRSAILIVGDPWDRDYLRAKRWDLGILPTYRAMANWSVVCADIEELHPLYWDTYSHGEAFGIFNRKNVQKYGRMGEEKPDTAVISNPCVEATLEAFEPCNLQEIALPNIESPEEFRLASRLMTRYGQRVTLEKYHNAETQAVIERNRRVGTGITGCLASPLFNPPDLGFAYKSLQHENQDYADFLGIPHSIRTTVIKPSGTLSKLMDCPWAAGIHGGFSRHYVQRVRFAATDPLIPLLQAAGHHIEPVVRFDGTLDTNTLIASFYEETPASVPCSDEGHDTWKQLDVLLMAQKYWADQSVSVTVYYKREDIERIKDWLKAHLCEIKAISFLCHNDHGFKQAPWEAISKEAYDAGSKGITPIDNVAEGSIESMECEGGACPVR
jgi:ribonucleotide reductase alpha subunit